MQATVGIAASATRQCPARTRKRLLRIGLDNPRTGCENLGGFPCLMPPWSASDRGALERPSRTRMRSDLSTSRRGRSHGDRWQVTRLAPADRDLKRNDCTAGRPLITQGIHRSQWARQDTAGTNFVRASFGPGVEWSDFVTNPGHFDPPIAGVLGPGDIALASRRRTIPSQTSILPLVWFT
ncbi:hypothetical protein LZ31DRAFT_370678 [Colletotrichum somersetense]|nr:hypothetical protein LZ31DRAFT_370678 [Colletotrichum somersetense]